MSKSIFVSHESTEAAPRVIPEACSPALGRTVPIMNFLSLQSNEVQARFVAACAEVGAIQIRAVWVLVAVTAITAFLSAGAGALGLHLHVKGLKLIVSLFASGACSTALSALLWHRAEHRAKALGADELGKQWRNYCAGREALRKTIFLHRAGVLDAGALSKTLQQVCRQVWGRSRPTDQEFFTRWTSKQDPYLFDDGDDGFSSLELDRYVQLRAQGQKDWMQRKLEGKLAKAQEEYEARLRQILLWQTVVRWFPLVGESLSAFIGRLSAIETQRHSWLAVEQTAAGYTEVIEQMAAPLKAYEEFLAQCVKVLCERLAGGDPVRLSQIQEDFHEFYWEQQLSYSLAAEFVAEHFPGFENALDSWKQAGVQFLPELAKVVENILGAEHDEWLELRTSATSALQRALVSIFARGVTEGAPSGEGAQVLA